MSDEISLSIEETNKLRISLGLAPLEVQTKESAQSDQARINYEQQEAERAEERKAAELRERVEKSKAARDQQRKLKQTRTLGQAFDDEDEDESIDALRWIERSRRRQREAAPKQTKNRALGKRQEDGVVAATYSANDLAGLKVAHGVADISAGEEQVLTLQDRTIDELEEDGVELQSTLLADVERAKKNAENRKHLQPYALDAPGDTITEDSNHQRHALTINEGGIIDDETPEEREQREIKKRLGQSAIPLEMQQPQAISDFYTEEEASSMFRKPKKARKDGKEKKHGKRSRRNGKRSTNNDLLDDTELGSSTPGGEAMDVDRVNSILARQTQIDDSNFIDDDADLQRAIASVRRIESMKKDKAGAMAAVVPTAEDVAKQVRDDAKSRMDTMDGEHGGSSNTESGLVLSSTIEFVQSLAAAVSKPPVAPLHRQQEKEQAVAPATEQDDGEAHIVRGRQVATEADDAVPTPAAAHKGRLLAASTSKAGAKHTSASANAENEEDAAVDPAGILHEEQEPSIGSSLFATLSFLKQRNMIDKLSDEQKEKERVQRSRDEWIAEQRRKDAELQIERQRIKQMGRQPQDKKSSSSGRRGKPDAMTQRELEEERAREQELLDRKWAREYEQRMKDYKPEVKLEYVDDTGRQLTTKEAYKQLSHVFHGNYSGKNKIDKVMQKRERERKQMSLTSSNATHQYGEVLESAHKKLGIAGIVLSTGNRTGLSKDIVKKNSSQP